MASAALREQPTTVAVIHVDGLVDVSSIIDRTVAEQILDVVIQRLPAALSPEAGTTSKLPNWYLGQLSEAMLVLVLDSVDRGLIEACVSQVCASLRAPVKVGDAVFQLTPHAGVAILGRDAVGPKLLLEHARSAANDARRSGSKQIGFFSDTIKLRSLARLDVARELRDAIDSRHIRLRYAGRHDLVSGKLVARVGYLRWLHPLRGEVRPAEFVAVAEATGLAKALSQSVLENLLADVATLKELADEDVRLSFGALRHHLLHDEFVTEVSRLVAAGVVPAERLELRISERALVASSLGALQSLAKMGIQLVVDEVGRELSSLHRLACAPLVGMQLDRAWVGALRRDPVANGVCRAAIAIATSLGLTPIATGVDDAAQRDALLEIGCRQGIGDLYS